MTRATRHVPRDVPRRAGLALTIAASIGALTLSGCGVAGNQLHPGEAADVDGHEITTGRVDDIVASYCAYTAAQATPTADSATDPDAAEDIRVPRGFIRSNVLRELIQQEALNQILDQRDLDLPGSFDAQVAALREQNFTDVKVGDVEGMSRMFVFSAAAQTVIGESYGASSSKPSQTIDPTTGQALSEAQAKGQDELATWLSTHDVDVNPVFGLRVDDQGQVQFSDEDGSLAVSDTATRIDLAALDSGESLTDEQRAAIAAMPASQLCG